MKLKDVAVIEGWTDETKIYLIDKRSGGFFKLGKAGDILPAYGNRKVYDHSKNIAMINK